MALFAGLLAVATRFANATGIARNGLPDAGTLAARFEIRLKVVGAEMRKGERHHDCVGEGAAAWSGVFVGVGSCDQRRPQIGGKNISEPESERKALCVCGDKESMCDHVNGVPELRQAGRCSKPGRKGGANGQTEKTLHSSRCCAFNSPSKTWRSMDAPASWVHPLRPLHPPLWSDKESSLGSLVGQTLFAPHFTPLQRLQLRLTLQRGSIDQTFFPRSLTSSFDGDNPRQSICACIASSQARQQLSWHPFCGCTRQQRSGRRSEHCTAPGNQFSGFRDQSPRTRPNPTPASPPCIRPASATSKLRCSSNRPVQCP